MKPTTRNRPRGKERQAGQTTLTNFWRPTAPQKGRATDTDVTGEWGEGQIDKGLNAERPPTRAEEGEVISVTCTHNIPVWRHANLLPMFKLIIHISSLI